MIRSTCIAALLFLIPTGALAQSDGRARALFEAGRAAIEQGDYDAAYRHFSEAYELSQRPELLFNMANAAERLRHDEEAIRLYRQFLEELPDAENRAYVEGRIRALEPEPPEDTGDGETTDPGDGEVAGEPPGEPVTDPPAPATGGGGSDPTGWIILAGGAAVAVAGAVMLGVGAAERSNVDGAPVGSSWDDYMGAHDLANTLMPTGGVLLGVGVAVAVVGVVVAVTSSGSPDAEVALRLGPGSVALEGSF